MKKIAFFSFAKKQIVQANYSTSAMDNATDDTTVFGNPLLIGVGLGVFAAIGLFV